MTGDAGRHEVGPDGSVDHYERIRTAVAGTFDATTAMTRAVEILKETPAYSWVGIYLLDDDELVLGPFLGKPSPHTRIPLGRGICGAAASEKASIIVDDVNADPRYLACSIETRSEIVVRMLTHDDTPIDEQFWRGRLSDALALRRTLNLDAVTDACRLVHAEGDHLSGIVIERYGDYLAAEVFALGMWSRARSLLATLADLLAQAKRGRTAALREASLLPQAC